MSSLRGISRPTTTTIVPAKTPENQLISSAPNFDSQLSRFQDGVTDTLDSVLMWLNSHFGVAPPSRSTDGRTVTPDITTLVAADTGTVIASSYPLTVQVPNSALTASMSNSVVSQIALPLGAQVVSLYVSAPVPTGGQGTLSVQPNSVSGWQGAPISGSSGIALTSGVVGAPVSATSSICTLSLYANTSSSWAIPSGTVYVTLYVAQSVGS